MYSVRARVYKGFRGQATVYYPKWCGEFGNKCQAKARLSPETTNEMEMLKENLRLRKELEEAKKEILFLKKAAAFFAREID